MAITLILASVLAVILFALYLLTTWKFNYWKKKNVPHLKPTPLLGNYGAFLLMRKRLGKIAQELCQAFPREPFVGAYYGTEPMLIVQDPELIKLITTKDYASFNGREASNYSNSEIVTRNMFFSSGDRWKVVRQNMSPLFTSLKMKSMFHLIEKCAHSFEDMLDHETSISEILEIRVLIARYTMDAIGGCGFGVDMKVTNKDISNNPFPKIGEMIFENSNVRGIATYARAIWPFLFYRFGFKLFSPVITKFFDDMATGVFKSRQYEPTARNDFVDMILNLKKSGYITSDSLVNPGQKVNLEVDDEFLVSQCVMFFAAGFETSATTLGFTLYELAKDERAQNLAIEEVDEYLRKKEGKLSYECVNELPYLEACIDEALRLYPVLDVITREVMADYTLPGGVKLDKGVRIHLPVYHIQRSAEHFPEPNEFRPERFLGEAKNNIKPYTYFPFGEGPRICIGMRFAKMQMLPGLVTILKKYRMELAKGTPRTLNLEPKTFVIQSHDPLNLKLVRRDGWEQRKFSR